MDSHHLLFAGLPAHPIPAVRRAAVNRQGSAVSRPLFQRRDARSEDASDSQGLSGHLHSPSAPRTSTSNIWLGHPRHVGVANPDSCPTSEGWRWLSLSGRYPGIGRRDQYSSIRRQSASTGSSTNGQSGAALMFHGILVRAQITPVAMHTRLFDAIYGFELHPTAASAGMRRIANSRRSRRLTTTRSCAMRLRVALNNLERKTTAGERRFCAEERRMSAGERRVAAPERRIAERRVAAERRIAPERRLTAERRVVGARRVAGEQRASVQRRVTPDRRIEVGHGIEERPRR
jgi:hypothetical protein